MSLGKKRVLHLSHTDVRVDSRILKQACGLGATGRYDVRVLGIARGSQEMEKLGSDASIKALELFFVKVRFKPSLFRHFLAFIEFFFKSLNEVRRFKPEVLHCHDTIAFFIGSMLSLVYGTKLVYDAHELESAKNGSTKLGSLLTLAAEKMFWRRVTLFVSVSPSILTWYTKRFGEKDTCLVLNSPVLESSPPKNNEGNYYRQHFKLEGDAVVFLYLGLLAEGRGISELVESFSDVDRRAHLVLMGYGPLESKLKDIAARNDNIHLHQAVPHDQVVSLAASADVGVCFLERVSLSYYYALPNKLFEYAFAGIPVLASNFPDLSNYVNKYGLGRCAAAEVNEIRFCINEFCTAPIEFDSKCLDELSWQRQMERLLTAYQKVCRV